MGNKQSAPALPPAAGRLMAAAKRGDADALLAALDDEGAFVDCRDENGFTPLFYAAAYGHAECVVELVCHGADRGALAHDGSTAEDWVDPQLPANIHQLVRPRRLSSLLRNPDVFFERCYVRALRRYPARCVRMGRAADAC